MAEIVAQLDESIAGLLYRVSLAARGGVIVPGESGSRSYSWREVAELACQAADGLARSRISRGEHVAIAAGNSLEWIVADLAIHILGCVAVPLHGSLTGSQLAWQLVHSDCKLLIAGGAAVIDKLTDLPAELQLISLAPAKASRDGRAVLLWSELLDAGDLAAGEDRWRFTRENTNPDALASIVYTSGTSGEPRGVMLTQKNLGANAIATFQAFGRTDDDCRLNSLPFSHAFGRMSDLYVSLAADSWLALARSRETLVADARQVRPTLMVVVPLLLARLRQAASATFGDKDSSAVQKLLGGRLRGFICGGAALAEEVRDYFAAQGTPVYEGYGLTEASPVVSASSPGIGSKPGSMGTLLADTEARTADDGELLLRGPQVMAGYWRDENATAETLRDGWLHTGDLGVVDANGFLSLNGRKKEFIALASGKKIWPAAIEGLFVGDPLIEQIMLVGEGEKSLGALVVLKAQSPDSDVSSVLDHISQRLAQRPAHEQIRRAWLLAEPWLVEREELTPKLTLRRSVILRRYADCVRRMYDQETTP